MSNIATETNDKKFFSTIIKLEDDSDDELIYNNSSELDNYLTSSNEPPSALLSTYKGKIEVTSKGRRKIFDGVRWQILCRRSECRKQTNKKSLCITHYKEEYEIHNKPSSWPNNLSSFQVHHNQQYIDRTRVQNEIENQNNTISTTNITDNKNRSLISEGQIELTRNGRRFFHKNNKCKYNSNCRNVPKYSSLCINHFQISQQKQRESFKLIKTDERQRSSYLNFSNGITRRLKINDNVQTSPSSFIEQFHINSNMSTDAIDNNVSLPSTFSKSQIEQSVQTDLTIPLCCKIYQQNHSIFSTCIHHIKE